MSRFDNIFLHFIIINLRLEIRAHSVKFRVVIIV